ncbi:MAG: hypothetical protein ACE5KM_04280 [Planctomycetaceae bacterium]
MRRWIRWGLLVTAVIAVPAGYYAYRQHKRFKNLDVHEPGMVYRSGWLEPGAMQETIEKHQIRTVVNLCSPGEMGDDRWVREREAVKNAGARLVEAPMPLTLNADDKHLRKHLEVLSNPDNYPLLVHCQHGVTRTSKFLAMYDIAFRGISGDDSLAAQPLFGRDEQNVHVRAFVKEFEKQHRKLYPTANADRLSILRQ